MKLVLSEKIKMLCESEGRRSSLALNIANVMYTSILLITACNW